MKRRNPKRIKSLYSRIFRNLFLENRNNIKNRTVETANRQNTKNNGLTYWRLNFVPIGTTLLPNICPMKSESNPRSIEVLYRVETLIDNLGEKY